MKSGNEYVAAANEPLRKVDYQNIEDVHTKRRNYKRPDLSKILPPVVVAPSKAMQKIEKPLTLFLLPNGDKTGHAVKLLLWKRDAADFQRVLELVTEKLGERLPYGNAKRLHRLQGKEVRGYKAALGLCLALVGVFLPHLRPEYGGFWCFGFGRAVAGAQCPRFTLFCAGAHGGKIAGRRILRCHRSRSGQDAALSSGSCWGLRASKVHSETHCSQSTRSA